MLELKERTEVEGRDINEEDMVTLSYAIADIEITVPEEKNRLSGRVGNFFSAIIGALRPSFTVYQIESLDPKYRAKMSVADKAKIDAILLGIRVF